MNMFVAATGAWPSQPPRTTNACAMPPSLAHADAQTSEFCTTIVGSTRQVDRVGVHPGRSAHVEPPVVRRADIAQVEPDVGGLAAPSRMRGVAMNVGPNSLAVALQ